MQFTTLGLASLLALVSVVAAQSSGTGTTSAPDSSPTAGLSECVLGCVLPAATDAGCNGITDFSCLCTSQSFQDAAAQCLSAQCTAEEQAAALQLQQTQCADITSSSGTDTASDTASGTASVTVIVSSVAAPTTTGVSTTTTAPTSTSLRPTSTTNTSSSAASSTNAAVAVADGASAYGAIAALLAVVGLL